ncbi:MAG: hypothetical protein VB961_00410 [Dehalococcoidia bacterium]
MLKRVLNTPVSGWVDHVAGADGGAALGLVLAGTGIFLLRGADAIRQGTLSRHPSSLPKRPARRS